MKEPKSEAANQDGSSALASAPLLACPFCGSLEEPQAKHAHIILDGKHALQCWNCGATGPLTVSEQMMDKHWNRREGVWNNCDHDWYYEGALLPALGLHRRSCGVCKVTQQFNGTTWADIVQSTVIRRPIGCL
jgi:Lar family restriction alleviation protein